ncbi:hypothetical protein PG994_008083 [Apiospora phragmitis]|uniref:Uncharacterized protein n=1 Tax=Apiospora phragmitis TaxID=2905665 RepID=A0ABR1USQ5_9PEZI
MKQGQPRDHNVFEQRPVETVFGAPGQSGCTTESLDDEGLVFGFFQREGCLKACTHHGDVDSFRAVGVDARDAQGLHESPPLPSRIFKGTISAVEDVPSPKPLGSTLFGAPNQQCPGDKFGMRRVLTSISGRYQSSSKFSEPGYYQCLRCTGELTTRDEPCTADTVSISGLPLAKDQQSLSFTKLAESIPQHERHIPASAKACPGSDPSSCTSSHASSWPPSTASEASSGPSLVGWDEEDLTRPPTLTSADVNEVPVVHGVAATPAVHPVQLPLLATDGEGKGVAADDAIDKLVYNAIREVLREDGGLAEEVINAVKHSVGSGRGVVYQETHKAQEGATENDAETDITQVSHSSQATPSDTATPSDFAPSSSLEDSRMQKKHPVPCPPPPTAHTSGGPPLVPEGEQIPGRTLDLQQQMMPIRYLSLLDTLITAPYHSQSPSLTTHEKTNDGINVDAVTKLIHSSIREVLVEDSTYAEEVINAVKHSIGSERELLYLETHESPEDATGNNTETNTTTQASPPSQSSAPETANSSKTLSSSLGGRTNRKRRPGSSDSSNNPRPQTKKSRGSRENNSLPPWPCPYCLAYVLLPFSDGKFWACRLPSSLAKRDNFNYLRNEPLVLTLRGSRAHLKDYHFHNPAPGEISSAYFMTSKQWHEVEGVLRSASLKHHPKGIDEWFEAQTECYLDIWRILFPPEFFPTLAEPSNPFHMTSPDHREPLEQVNILFSALQYVDASRASGDATKIDKHRPTTDDIQRNMKDAFAIAIKLLAKHSPTNARYLEILAVACTATSLEYHLAGREPSLALTSPPKPLWHTDTITPQHDWGRLVRGVFCMPATDTCNLQFDQMVRVKVPSASFDCLASNPGTAVLVLWGLCSHQLTDRIMRHGEPASSDSIISPSALLAMPLADPAVPPLPSDAKEKWVAKPDSPSIQALENHTYESNNCAGETPGFFDGIMANLGTDDPWPFTDQCFLGSHHPHDDQADSYLDWNVATPEEDA